jgi:hypothetical protein
MPDDPFDCVQVALDEVPVPTGQAFDCTSDLPLGEWERGDQARGRLTEERMNVVRMTQGAYGMPSSFSVPGELVLSTRKGVNPPSCAPDLCRSKRMLSASCVCPESGTPFITSSHASLTSPSDQTYAEVNAALPFGKGYAQFWVSEWGSNPAARGGGSEGGGGSA